MRRTTPQLTLQSRNRAVVSVMMWQSFSAAYYFRMNIEMTEVTSRYRLGFNPETAKTIAVALTGASGMPYGLRLIECLLDAGCRVQVLYSQVAQIVARQELDIALPSRAEEAQKFLVEAYDAEPDQLAVYGREEWFAPLASGSNPPDAMVICPCSMGTLAAVAAGLSSSLIERAADVCLKERRTLVLVPRETPFSTLHLENMLRLSRMGAVILPPSPGFYHHPKSIDDLVDFVVARIMDQISVPQTLMARWGEAAPSQD